MNSKPKLRDNGNGGGPTMRDNDYVNHQELELSNEKLLRHIDEKFNDMDKKWINGLITLTSDSMMLTINLTMLI